MLRQRHFQAAKFNKNAAVLVGMAVAKCTHHVAAVYDYSRNATPVKLMMALR